MPARADHDRQRAATQHVPRGRPGEGRRKRSAFGSADGDQGPGVAVLERGDTLGQVALQHADPAGLTRALMAMLHEGADVDAARAMLR